MVALILPRQKSRKDVQCPAKSYRENIGHTSQQLLVSMSPLTPECRSAKVGKHIVYSENTDVKIKRRIDRNQCFSTFP